MRKEKVSLSELSKKNLDKVHQRAVLGGGDRGVDVCICGYICSNCPCTGGNETLISNWDLLSEAIATGNGVLLRGPIL